MPLIDLNLYWIRKVPLIFGRRSAVGLLTLWTCYSISLGNSAVTEFFEEDLTLLATALCPATLANIFPPSQPKSRPTSAVTSVPVHLFPLIFRFPASSFSLSLQASNLPPSSFPPVFIRLGLSTRWLFLSDWRRKSRYTNKMGKVESDECSSLQRAAPSVPSSSGP